MQLYASLHTENPQLQTSSEAYYAGYKRVPVDYSPQIGVKEPVMVLFPEIAEDSAEHAPIKYIAFGANEYGGGSISKVIECIPNKEIKKGVTIQVLIANIPEPLPDDLNPIARALWVHINTGDLAVESLSPDLFRTLNDELQRCGVPILKVTREGTAKMKIKFSQMKSLDLSEFAGHA